MMETSTTGNFVGHFIYYGGTASVSRLFMRNQVITDGLDTFSLKLEKALVILLKNLLETLNTVEEMEGLIN